MIVCLICGAMSDTDEQAEKHFILQHARTDWSEDPTWVRFAAAMFAADVMEEVSA